MGGRHKAPIRLIRVCNMNNKENRLPFTRYVPKGNSSNPARQTPVKAAVPEGSSNNPEKKQVAPKGGMPEGNARNPDNKQIAIKGGVPEVNTDNPKADVVIPVAARPEAVQTSTQHIGGWKGLNKRNTVDSQALSEAVNVSFKNFPFVESAKASERVQQLKITTKTLADDGTETITEQLTGEVYDVVTRGNELFIACDEGYVYGRIEDGKLKYIPMTETYGWVDDYELMPTEKTKCVFTETYDTTTDIIKINNNICVFGTWRSRSNGTIYLPVFPNGSIEFVDGFFSLLRSDKADTSRIYCVCDEKGRADEVWRYFTGLPKGNLDTNGTVDAWIELRRNATVVFDGSYIHLGYYTEAKSNFVNVDNYAGYSLKFYNKDDFENVDISTVDTLMADKGINQTADNICGLRLAYLNSKYGYYKRGIFNYEETTAPLFDSVVFYKARVFGSSGSIVMCSGYNNYNDWNLDVTDDITSANAWMSTTTANSAADGNIITMHEYLGRISVLKSGFMQEVYGGSNPFSVQDVYAVGTPFPFGVCEAYGRLCFAGKEALRIYGGSFPKAIGDEIGVDVYDNVIMLGSDRSLVIKTGDEVYRYDFLLGMWVQMQSEHFEGVKRFFMLGGDMYAVTRDGGIIKLDGSDYGEWSFATCAMTESTLRLKRLQKIRLTYSLGAGALFDMSVVKSDGSETKALSRENGTEKTVTKRAEMSLTNAVDWFLKLRFSGRGYFRLISLDMEIKNGGAVYE